MTAGSCPLDPGNFGLLETSRSTRSRASPLNEDVGATERGDRHEQEREEAGVDPRRRRMCAIVTAVLLFGLMTSTGALYVVSVITTAAGAATVVIGLYQAFHHPRPHPSV